MNDDLRNIQYSPIRNHPYTEWFREIHFNGRELSAADKKEYLKVANENILQSSEGLIMMRDTLERIKNLHDEFHEIQRTLVSVMQFCMITVIDSIVLCKYFIMADKDYDRRLMRGKLMVVLNEGFKRLYGFDDKTRKKSEWNRIKTILHFFPETIQQQYNHLSSLLEKHANSSSWWRDERNVETHLDAEKLYASRCEEIVEGKVIADSVKLFNTFYAVNQLLFNMHSCIYNFLLDKYLRGELKEED